MHTPYPSFAAIEALHKKYAPSEEAFQRIFGHCQIVRDIALQLIDTSGISINRELVEIGCLLHDIGTYEFFDTETNRLSKPGYITHGIRGEALLQQEGFPEELCRFASHHTGVGLTKEHIIERDLPLPHMDFLAESLEEELVMYADNFHSKGSKSVFNSYDHCVRSTAKYGAKNIDTFHKLTDTFGVPDLEPLIAKFGADERT